mmetsp:Transcript_11616/g.16117  ORF Transcript_11616/g.16117 Transcript_11616/m.16117 type:complete len:128 (+) Transcript_11616:41-424(+)
MKWYFFVISTLLTANSVALYGATLTGWTNEVANAYGIHSDPHFLRTVGLFLGVFAFLNVTVTFWGAIGLKTLFLSNSIIIIHYMVETFYFRALNLSIMLPLLFTFAGNVLLFYLSPKSNNTPPKKTN